MTVLPDDESAGQPADRRPLPRDERGGTLLQRSVSLALGVTLIAYGLGRRSRRGNLAALVGGWLCYQAVSGGGSLRKLPAVPSAPGSGSETAQTTVEQSITVLGEPEALYDRWQDPEQLSQVMGHFATVTPIGDGRLRWTVEGPMDREITYETAVIESQPGERLRWESPPDAQLPMRGDVRFEPAPGDRGTEVTLELQFEPPGGSVGSAALDRLGIVPETLAERALHRFKSLVETGEIPSTEANPSARDSGESR